MAKVLKVKKVRDQGTKVVCVLFDEAPSPADLANAEHVLRRSQLVGRWGEPLTHLGRSVRSLRTACGGSPWRFFG